MNSLHPFASAVASRSESQDLLQSSVFWGHEYLLHTLVYWCRGTSCKHTFRIGIRAIEFIGFPLARTGSLNQSVKSSSNLGSTLTPQFVRAMPRFGIFYSALNCTHHEINNRHAPIRCRRINALHRLIGKVQRIAHFFTSFLLRFRLCYFHLGFRLRHKYPKRRTFYTFSRFRVKWRRGFLEGPLPFPRRA